jgi:preprotein translocase subunit SecG
MFAFLAILMMIISVLLIIVILLQPGKGDMISGMSGLTGTFSSMLGSRRAVDLLSKITIGLATAILVLSLVTNKFFLNNSVAVIKPVTEGVAIPQTVPTSATQPIMPTPKKQDNKQQNQNQQQSNPQPKK